MAGEQSVVRDRLESAALELFAVHGFAATTVAEIAELAGLTKRTFFRHFSDKREVLFSGQSLLSQTFETAIAIAPDDAPPIAIVSDTLHAAAFMMEQRREFIRRRQLIIDGDFDLQEREAVKLALLTVQIAAALRRRGLDELTAALTAQIAAGSFTVAFDWWVRDQSGKVSLRECVEATLAHLPVLMQTKTPTPRSGIEPGSLHSASVQPT